MNVLIDFVVRILIFKAIFHKSNSSEASFNGFSIVGPLRTIMWLIRLFGICYALYRTDSFYRYPNNRTPVLESSFYELQSITRLLISLFCGYPITIFYLYLVCYLSEFILGKSWYSESMWKSGNKSPEHNQVYRREWKKWQLCRKIQASFLFESP